MTPPYAILHRLSVEDGYGNTPHVLVRRRRDTHESIAWLAWLGSSIGYEDYGAGLYSRFFLHVSLAPLNQKD